MEDNAQESQQARSSLATKCLRNYDVSVPGLSLEDHDCYSVYIPEQGTGVDHATKPEVLQLICARGSEYLGDCFCGYVLAKPEEDDPDLLIVLVEPGTELYINRWVDFRLALEDMTRH